MKWLKDKYTGNFICPKCGMMVRHNGYGDCDYEFCPYCGRAIEPVIAEEAEDNEQTDT